MAYHRLQTFSDCVRWGFDIKVECRGCGRAVRFSAHVLQEYATRKNLTQVIQWAGRHFVCKGRAGMPGCGRRGATLYPIDKGFDPPPPGPPMSQGEYVPKGIDPQAWARSDERGRKRLWRKARG